MTNWKARCAELLQAIDDDVLDVADGPRFQAAIDRTRAELAQPEPEGPTDEELDYWWAEIDGGPDCCGWRPYARAVLQRWGRPAIKPVPVRERLPGPEDCDEKGRCWAWNPEAFWWDLCQLKFIKMNAGDPFTHWLPHWALPVPTPEPGVADHITDDEGTRWDRTTDAALWAKAFCLICPEMASREDVMIGWFANAIMAGCDHQAWKMDAERKPVPVGERLPGEGDCDAEGRCWWGDAGNDEFVPSWRLCKQPDKPCFTHWLPHWALPVPNPSLNPQ